MNIVFRSKLNIDRLLRCAGIFAAALMGFVGVGWLLFIVLYPRDFADPLEEAEARAPQQQAPLFYYESIGTGALALNPQQSYGWVTEIARELFVVAYNSRPDVSQRESTLLLALKKSKEQIDIINGKTLFLNEEDQLLKFSDKPRSLWVKPILLDNGGVLVEVGRKLGPLESPHSEEKGQFVISALQAKGKLPQQASQLFIQALKSARGWGSDQLVQKYGGREYAAWRDKYKLDFVQGNSPYACFVSAGDRLIWEKGRWRVVDSDEATEGFPMALVRAVSHKEIDVDAWDEGGFYPVHFRVSLETAPKFTGKVEGMPSMLRMRTATQVSCLLGKKRLILRQGDWVLKTPAGWRILRKSQDIQHCLYHELRGELFIFDCLEKENGRWVFKGNFFDEMRTQSQPLTIPIDTEKKTVHTGKKRKLPFATKSVLPLWFSLDIPNVFQNLVSGKAGVSDLQPAKQTMCTHMVDADGYKDENAGEARNQILKYVRYSGGWG